MILQGLATDIFEYNEAIPKKRRTLLLEELKTLTSAFYRLTYRVFSRFFFLLYQTSTHTSVSKY